MRSSKNLKQPSLGQIVLIYDMARARKPNRVISNDIGIKETIVYRYKEAMRKGLGITFERPLKVKGFFWGHLNKLDKQ